MALSTVMQTAFSGMNAATTIINVTADNLANYQTPGFKASTVRLATLPPQSLSPAGSTGSNPIQLGYGVQVVGIERDFSQGPIQLNNQLPLLALDGEGLFILHSNDGRQLFTRDGRFHFNAKGELVTGYGDLVLGFGVDADGQIDRSQLRPLKIHLGSAAVGVSGNPAILRSYSISKNGKFTGRYSDGINRTLGQLRLARFANPAGLQALAGNRFASTPASGLPIESDPVALGVAEVVSHATENSNVDMAGELIELALTGNLFHSNLAVLHATDDMLSALFFPWRRA